MAWSFHESIRFHRVFGHSRTVRLLSLQSHTGSRNAGRARATTSRDSHYRAGRNRKERRAPDADVASWRRCQDTPDDGRSSALSAAGIALANHARGLYQDLRYLPSIVLQHLRSELRQARGTPRQSKSSEETFVAVLP